MKELLDKLSSYNIFNYLLPGTLFALLAERTADIRIIQTDIFIGLFLYYFIGLVISRVGSLVLEPLMRRVAFVKYAPYEDFVRVSARDPKLEILSETNNMYRTLCALFFTLVVLTILERLVGAYLRIPAGVSSLVLFGALFILFALSYRKQTHYVTQRIEAGKTDSR